MPKVVRVLVPLAFIVVIGCRYRQPTAPAAPGPAQVTAARPIRLPVTDYQEYTGYLEAVETVIVRARVRGYLDRVAFTEGTDVDDKQTLYEIDPREYEAALKKAKADENKARSELRRATSEQDRAERLRRDNAMSEEEYTQKVVATELARAAVQQAEAAVAMAELDRSFTTIKAPLSGRIGRTLVTKGNLVGYNEATPLTTIVRMDEFYVYFDVPEQYAIQFDQLASRQSSAGSASRTIPIHLGVANETGYPHPGYLDFSENRVDPGTGTIRLRGRVKNSKGVLYPGLYARVQVPESAEQLRFMVPEAALMTDQRGRYVFVVKPDQTVEARTVTVGSRRGNLISIISGVSGEDTVIINGLQRVRPAAKVQAEIVPLQAPPKEHAGATGTSPEKVPTAPGKASPTAPRKASPTAPRKASPTAPGKASPTAPGKAETEKAPGK